jgi:Tfp pilus assembly protein PilO
MEVPFKHIFNAKRLNPLAVAAASTLLSLLILYFGWTALVSTQTAALDAKRKELAELSDQNQVNRQVEQEEPQLRAEVARVKAAYCEASPLVSKDADVSKVLADIQGKATRFNVTLTGFQAFKAAVNSPQFDKLQQRDFPASATGTYPNVRRFFQSVAQMNRIVVVPEYRLVSVTPRVSTGFTLYAYNEPPKVPSLPAAYGSLQCSDALTVASSDAPAGR